MKSLFIINDAENCKQEPSPGVDILRIAMSESAILQSIEHFKIGLIATKGKKNHHVTFGFHGELISPLQANISSNKLYVRR